MSTGRAPGKILLLGEHAVVYGHPALAAAIPLYVNVVVDPADKAQLVLPGGMPTPVEVLDAAIAIAREAGWRGGFRARVQSEIPLGSGLGSSAALGVALGRAFKPGCAPDEAAALAMQLERVLHGAPSGVDPAACARGGVIYFVRGEPPKIEPVSGSAWLCVALTGIARGTRSTVMPLKERRKTDPSIARGTRSTVMPLKERRKTDPSIDPKLARLGELARLGRGLRGLGPLMDEAHALLRELGVSCPELEEAVAKLKAAGALGAKLTGAGGGGAAIGLARDEAHAREIAAETGGFAVEIGS